MNTPTEPVQPTLLVVDDDPGIRDLLSRYLGQQGYTVATVGDGLEMDQWLQQNSADLVILDLMLPGEDGLSLARRLRADGNLPVIIVSARGDEVDRIVGLEVGADDYLAKPFNPRELLARIRAVLRRQSVGKAATTAAAAVAESTSQPGDIIEFGPFVLNFDTRQLMQNTQDVTLSRAEFDLLEVLARHPNRTLSRDFIIETIAGHERDTFDRSIDVRVTRLRRKIEPQPSHPVYIRTVWGLGYLFHPHGANT